MGRGNDGLGRMVDHMGVMEIEKKDIKSGQGMG